MKTKLYFLLAMTVFAGLFHGQTYNKADQTIWGSNITSDVVVYPNPAIDNINIKLNNRNLKIKAITIYAIIGKVVADYKNLNQNTVSLRIDNLKPGKYLLKYMLSDNTQHVTQLIKQ